MLMTIAAFGVASVALLSSISSEGNTTHDQRSKDFACDAESGVSDAMLRYNLTAAPTPCAPVGGSPDANGWCPGLTISPAVNGARSSTGSIAEHDAEPALPEYSTPTACVEVVALGTLDGVTRRVDQTATSATNAPCSPRRGQGDDSISLDSNAVIHSGVATNGSITLNSNAKQCGNASVGSGRH